MTNSPAKLSTVWFSPNERSLATAISSNINLIGVGIGFVIPAGIVVSDNIINIKE